MDTHSKASQTIAVVMAVLLGCFIFTGNRVMAIVDKDIDEILQIHDDGETKEENPKKLNRRERKEAKEMTERLKMLQK